MPAPVGRTCAEALSRITLPVPAFRILGLGLGLYGAVDEAVAGALGHVHPGVLLRVALRGSCARRVRGLAVVLASLRDTVALLVVKLRYRRRLGTGDGGHRDRGGDDRGEEQARVHGIILLLRADERAVRNVDPRTTAVSSAVLVGGVTRVSILGSLQ